MNNYSSLEYLYKNEISIYPFFTSLYLKTNSFRNFFIFKTSKHFKHTNIRIY